MEGRHRQQSVHLVTSNERARIVMYNARTMLQRSRSARTIHDCSDFSLCMYTRTSARARTQTHTHAHTHIHTHIHTHEMNTVTQVGTLIKGGNPTDDSDRVKAPVVGAGPTDFFFFGGGGEGHIHYPKTEENFKRLSENIALLVEFILRRISIQCSREWPGVPPERSRIMLKTGKGKFGRGGTTQ